MTYNNLSNVDVKLKLLSGGSINVENLVIKPYTLREISDYGYTKYMRNLQWILIEKEDFISSVSDLEQRTMLEEQKSNLLTFDFYVRLGGKELLESLMMTISMIFRTKDVRLLDDDVIAIDLNDLGIFREDEDGEVVIDHDALDSVNQRDMKIIHRGNFDELVKVIKLQNYLLKPNERDESSNPADEETRRLIEEMEKYRKKVEAKKKAQQIAESGEEESVDISDIISSISSKSNSINKLNIWDLTIYQIYDEYARLELIDNYEFSIQAMMAGAKDIELKHWSSKL